MKKLVVLAGIMILVACNKENNPQPPPMSRTDFFSNEKDLQQKIQTALDQHRPGEKLERIESISYIDSRNKSFAFVFYRSNKGSSNVVIQKQYLGRDQYAVNSVKCDGAGCDCKVKTIIGNNGDVTLDCSCSSCTMLVNTVAAPNYN